MQEPDEKVFAALMEAGEERSRLGRGKKVKPAAPANMF